MLRNPVFWGVLFSLIMVSLALFLGAGETCNVMGECSQRFDTFLKASPNEIGDTLAGFAGSLAFIWIIVTVLLQSRELAAQREELTLTRKEMQEQRAATQEMAKSMGAQAEIFKDEQIQRRELQAGLLFREELELISSLLIRYRNEIVVSAKRGPPLGNLASYFFNGSDRFGVKLCLLSVPDQIALADKFAFINDYSESVYAALVDLIDRKAIITKSNYKMTFGEIAGRIRDAANRFQTLSSADRNFAVRTRIDESAEIFEKILDLPIWEDCA
ncbi:hypothetical protein [uncultured Tateyamaria sp.]|uniref:hypothetical protein n=1 Tax=uncultured Tateyamaria sp. TaxID=455651 RepID=UPI002606658F|nr:hypothetical protein [uncultured Tateyamaria sp.]